MLSSNDTFTESIKDAENLLSHFEALNSHPPPDELEVLKRAGLIMAMTAWETYVEDRLFEVTTRRLDRLNDLTTVHFVRHRLKVELKRLHNPDSSKTIALFRDYAGVDLNDGWNWNNFDLKTVKCRLDDYLKLRGDVVHRARAAQPSIARLIRRPAALARRTPALVTPSRRGEDSLGVVSVCERLKRSETGVRYGVCHD